MKYAAKFILISACLTSAVWYGATGHADGPSADLFKRIAGERAA